MRWLVFLGLAFLCAGAAGAATLGEAFIGGALGLGLFLALVAAVAAVDGPRRR